MTTRVDHHAFETFNPIYIFLVLKSAELACDTRKIYKGLAMWLFFFFKNNSASTLLNAQLSAKRNEKRTKQ